MLSFSLASTLLILFFSPVHLPGGLTLPNIDQHILSYNRTFFQSAGALSGCAKGVLVANAAWLPWRALVLLLSWYVLMASLASPLFNFHFKVGLWIFGRHGCMGLCRPHSWKEVEFGHLVLIYSRKSDGGGASDTKLLPWSWSESTQLRVQEAYDVYLTLHVLCLGSAPRGRFLIVYMYCNLYNCL